MLYFWQVLVDDSARLQAEYPGGNADHIRAQQALVVDSWNALQERMGRRKEELQASSDLQRFLTSARDLTAWSTALVASMSTKERVHDANEAQALRAEHERLKAEIEAREDVFSAAVQVLFPIHFQPHRSSATTNVEWLDKFSFFFLNPRGTIQAAETMVQEEHYAQGDVRERLKQLLDERQRLHGVWQRRKVYLDQLLDLMFFLRDAKQIESICNTQEVSSICNQHLMDQRERQVSIKLD